MMCHISWLEQFYTGDLHIIERLLRLVDCLKKMEDETVFCMALIQSEMVHHDLLDCELRSLQQVLKVTKSCFSEMYFGESLAYYVAKIETGTEQDDIFIYTIVDGFLEFDFYTARKLDESLLADVQDFDILDWWKQNSSKYLILSIIASDILYVPVSYGLNQDSALTWQKRGLIARAKWFEAKYT